MDKRYKHDEYSLRRSISNTLRKSSLLKNGINNNKNIALKKFVPNIDNLKNENKSKNDEVDKLETLNNKNIQELIKKTISLDLQKETKKENFNNKINKAFSSQNIDISLNNQINLLNLEKISDNNENIEKKKKTSINIYELNNISKNIFYNKKCASPNAHFLPLTLPFFTNNEKQKKIRKMLLNKESFFFYIQLPNMLPAIKQKEESDEEQIKEKEEINESKQKKEKKKFNKSKKYSYELSNINTLPNGKFAKLIIYKNKKIKMKINDILFDVNEGSACTFSQEIGCYIRENSEFIFLGNCDHKIVVTPNIERIIHNK
ncbi:DNA-directed RNA polymerase III subunit RPC4, putative [Plasmodium relictum]|uniref:DNA-directed RNA polymerase III subunit RPC4, putative n=1 Tax=Plasmodium relictum TaxID=85471 RepID=A0A1J1HCI0_PLARL|nr:DNA-directed RNA polymerase III subunit RPC4, putative [Plasmodium relictum]CRH01290.1 DNA-directed RNA polymerase III subunit RPC4, putative [Plasmodium relictum]